MREIARKAGNTGKAMKLDGKMGPNRWVPTLGAATVALVIVIAGFLPALAEVSTPPKGSPLRSALLDAVRPMVEAELGAPVEFVVDQLRVLGEWAFVLVRPQRPGGGKIEYVYTKYQTAIDQDMFDNDAIALLRQTPKGWLVYEYVLGATDVPWVEWPKYYPVPPELFPN
jgi:hypothetical protein